MGQHQGGPHTAPQPAEVCHALGPGQCTDEEGTRGVYIPKGALRYPVRSFWRKLVPWARLPGHEQPVVEGHYQNNVLITCTYMCV